MQCGEKMRWRSQYMYIIKYENHKTSTLESYICCIYLTLFFALLELDLNFVSVMSCRKENTVINNTDCQSVLIETKVIQ